MNRITATISRSLFALALLVIGIAASPAAHAQCNTITVDIEKVFPMSDVAFTGALTLVNAGSMTTVAAITAGANGTFTILYDPTISPAVGGVLDLMGIQIPANSSAIVPGPLGFPSCLCLEVSFTIDPSGCVIIRMRPVCC